MKIYLAAPWVTRSEMPAISSKLEENGHSITWKWWQTENIPEGERNSQALRLQAEHDREGVTSAQVMVVINSAKSEGKATEQGIAIAHRLPIIAVGKLGEHSINVFHYLSSYKWVDTVDDAIDLLNTFDWLVSNAS